MKKIISFILCLCIISFCGITATADNAPVIKISNVTADNGDEVTVDISIANNPGIMAMAFCITYDSSALEYTGYNKGYLSKYTVKDHIDKGHIAFVNDESSDKATDGIIVSIKFKVKDDARGKKYEIEKKMGERMTDASSYSFYMQFADGGTVQTSAYNASPDNFMTVLNVLGKEFETLFAEDE